MRRRTPWHVRAINVLVVLASLPPLRIAAVLLVIAGGLMLAGCAASPQLVQVKVPMPVECRVATPARPSMPTDALQPVSTLDAIVAATLAEIELREGYELELRAALDTCTAPLPPPAPP